MLRNIILSITLLLFSFSALAADKKDIDQDITETMALFKKEYPSAAPLLKKASGVLVFPKVIKGGFGIGGAYGEGALMVNGKKVQYYSRASASFGFQFGGQIRREIILFMTNKELKKFRSADGWEAGVDGSVAVVKVGTGGAIDTKSLNSPVVGFIFGSKGLMVNASIEGAKMSKINR